MSLHFVGGEGLLLDRSGQCLYSLNASAAVIWSCLKQGKSRTETIRLLSQQFSLPAERAARFLSDTLRQYEALSQAIKPPPSGIPHPAATAAESAEHGHAPRPRPETVQTAVRRYRLVDSIFRVHFDSTALLEHIHPLLALHETVVETTDIVDVAVVVEEAGIAAFTSEKIIGRCASLNEAAVMVRACLIELTITSSDGLCAVHACALRRNGSALLLPGEAGSGKSTLSAALAARNFEMLSDDTTLIAGDPPVARSIPTGLCIKPGSYAALESYHPQIHSQTEWHRPDGKRARYLMPRRDIAWADPDAVAEVRWIVFPTYRPGGRTVLSSLRPHEALTRLLPGLYALAGTLDDSILGKLIPWIERVDCSELSVASLEIATSLLDEHCR